MSSSSCSVCWVGFVLVPAFLCALVRGTETDDNQLSCPATITVKESAAGIPGWKTDDKTSNRPFQRISMFNGTNGGQEYELAPDEQKQNGGIVTQVWNLRAYRDMNIFIRCRYADTQVVFSRDVPKSLQLCRFTFTHTKNGSIIDKPSFACR